MLYLVDGILLSVVWAMSGTYIQKSEMHVNLLDFPEDITEQKILYVFPRIRQSIARVPLYLFPLLTNLKVPVFGESRGYADSNDQNDSSQFFISWKHIQFDPMRKVRINGKKYVSTKSVKPSSSN